MVDAAVPELGSKFPCLDLELKLQHYVELMRGATSADDQLKAMLFAREWLPAPASLTAEEMQEPRARLLVRLCAHAACHYRIAVTNPHASAAVAATMATSVVLRW